MFIAYGLLGLRLMTLAIPFLIGRFVSYSFSIFTASEISERVAVQSLKTRHFFGAYFVVGQVLTLLVVYLFTRIDWRALIADRKLKWLHSQPCLTVSRLRRVQARRHDVTSRLAVTQPPGNSAFLDWVRVIRDGALFA